MPGLCFHHAFAIQSILQFSNRLNNNTIFILPDPGLTFLQRTAARIVEEAMTPAMRTVGENYRSKGADIIRILAAARSVRKGFELLEKQDGQLYTGDTVQILDTSDAQYWYVYSPKYDLNGFVNKDYLSGTASYSSRTVRVSKGYLALRSSKAYTTANETGELYTGDTVEIIDTNDPTYWYVYAPKLNNYGYVNKDYLY